MASPNDGFKYDVFLSFKGKNDLNGFPENLWKALHSRGMKTFIDDEELRKGQEMTTSLVKAIQDSNMAIIVLSKDYASFSSCLQTLSMILDSIKDKGRLVLPVFHQLDPFHQLDRSHLWGRSKSLDPSHVRHLIEFYEEAMAEHEMRYNMNVEKWKIALEVVAGLPGFHFNNRFHNDKESDLMEIVHYLDELEYPKHRKGREITAFPNCRFKYGVFLSFRGEDTRQGFARNLWEALKKEKINPFMDEVLDRGKEIEPSLIEAIHDSKMAIIVLSKDYASSPICLQELSTILDSMKGKDRLVWPVFYQVEPSDVKNSTGSYGDAMAKHEARSETKKWKQDLRAVALLTGTVIKKGEGYECDIIKKIVEEVSRKFIPRTLHVPDYLIGLEYKKENLTCHLRLLSDDVVHMVGIYGIGGIGKTTLALEVYNSIVHQFDGFCYLENVRDNSDKNGLIYLQKIVLSEIVDEKNIEITSVRQGISILNDRLRDKKILLLLDEVDKKEQLDAIAGKSNWFGPGSRVIITTRDIRLLTCHGVETKYEVNGLNDEDAFELVRWKAFMNETPFSGYEDVLKRAVTYASGHPLALEVIGSHFFKRSEEQCYAALDCYQTIPDEKIQSILQLSFDALRKEEKSVFLDIACCFNGYKLTRVEQILNAHHDKIMKHHISVLVEKSLIKISESGEVTLHDLLRDMGKEIVRLESTDYPGKRSRLWDSKDIIKVLQGNTGTKKIEIICPDSRIEVDCDGEAFKKMESLRTLIIRDGQFTESPKHLPNSLRILELCLDPSCDLPSEFYPKTLAIFNIPSNSTSFVWGDFFKKKFKDMRVLKFDFHKLLTRIPDISGLVYLEELSFRDCVNLVTVDASVGSLGKLKTLRVRGCIELRSIPPINLASLEELDLSRCHRLESFPAISDGSGNKLKTLFVSSCYSLRSIPPLKLDSLEHLDLSECYNLESVLSLVDGLSDKLKFLSIKRCVMLRSVPPLRLTSLEEFNLSYCPSLETFPKILGEMRNIPRLFLYQTFVKDVPFPVQNPVKHIPTYLWCKCRNAKLPIKVYAMSKLAQLTFEAETKLSPMQSSHVECLCLNNSQVSDKYLFESLMLFDNMKELHLIQCYFTTLPKSIENCKSLWRLVLSDCQELKEIEGIPPNLKSLTVKNCRHFTILPKSIEKCHSLWRLVLDGCEELKEIERIPPNLKTLSALNCKSLTSSCKSTLLNQELHEAGNTLFRLPRVQIPGWFEHKYSGVLSISFWFRNKFPAIVLGVVSPVHMSSRHLTVSINGNKNLYSNGETITAILYAYHLHIFHMQMENFNDNMDKALLENEWNHAEVDFKIPFMNAGIHVLKEKSNTNDFSIHQPE